MSSLPVFLFILVSACFFTFQITYNRVDSLWRKNVDSMIRTEGTRITDDLSAMQNAVSSGYLYDVSEDALIDGVMAGSVSALGDRYAMYLNEKQYSDYIKTTTAVTSVGIGVNMMYDANTDGIIVVSVYEASPAKQAGIVPGDIITHINGSPVSSYGFYGAVLELGHGNADDKIALSVKKADGESITTFIVKKEVAAKSIFGERLGNSIGLISIKSFDADGKEQFVECMQELIASGCEKLIIDVRNNGGGSIETATSILDFLLPSGTLVTVTSKSGTTNTATSDVNEAPYLFAVLVNERTVCEAEVFAAAMKNLGGAAIVGTTTCGKASKQSVFPLPDGGAVCFSTAAYLPSDGVSFDSVGITPDIDAGLSNEKLKNFTSLEVSEDDQIQKAIEYLKGKDAKKIKD